MVFDMSRFADSFNAEPVGLTKGVGFKGVLLLFGAQVISKDWF